MANIALGGARFIKRGSGGGNLEGTVEMLVASNNSTAIFRGDLVKRVNDGTVIVAAAGDSIYGIADGAVRYKGSDGVIGKAGNHLPASTTYSGSAVFSNPQASVIKVIPLFFGDWLEMDVDTGAADAATAQGLVGNNFDFVATAGNTSSGRSGFVINGASGFGTATAQLRMMAITLDPLNDVTAANWKAQFVVNETNEPTLGTVTGV